MTGTRAWLAIAIAVAQAATATSSAVAQSVTNPNPMDSISRLPGYRPAADTVPLITPARIDALPARQRGAWSTYIERSRQVYDRDTATMHAELRAVGRSEMVRAQYSHDFSVKPFMTDAWFAGDSAQRVAQNILTFQAPNGGWSKHVDLAFGPRQQGESYFAESSRWEWISTLDNDQTTEQMHFLARADRAHRDVRYEEAFLRGVDYLLEAQYPNGCWPQVYPLEGSYHDAATFNDDAIVNAMTLLGEVSAGEYAYVPRATRVQAGRAVQRGVECLLDAQVVVNGRRTAWPQQSDPITLRPTSARSYELTSLTALESVPVMRFLMSIQSPSARVVAAVHDAADWFKAVEVFGYTYQGQELRKAPGAGPLWARMYEIGTNRPIFSNREGRKLYDWNLLTDRRRGYGWFTDAPAAMLAEYDAWAKQHPR